MEGLPDRGSRPIQDDDAGDRRVHPPFPDPRPAEGASSHPPLRPVRQRRASRKHRPRPPTARRASLARSTCQHPNCRCRRTANIITPMPLLRRPHDHHRDLRARLNAAISPDHAGVCDRHRHIMIPRTRSRPEVLPVIIAGPRPITRLAQNRRLDRRPGSTWHHPAHQTVSTARRPCPPRPSIPT